MKKFRSSLQQSASQGKFQLRHLAVKAGDIITMSAMVYEGKKPTGQLLKSIAKTVVPGVVAYQLVDQVSNESSEAVVNKLPIISTGVAIIPGAIELSNYKTKKGKSFVRIEAFDSTGNKLVSQSAFATKVARTDYEELNVSYVAAKDGFIDLVASKSADPKSILVVGDVSQQTNISAEGSARKSSTPKDIIPVVPTANMCIDWYWEEYINGVLVNSTYLYSSCSIGGGGNGNTSSGGTGQGSGGTTGETPDSRNCRRCKELADNEKNAKMNEARYNLATNVGLWCHITGFTSGAATTATLSWLNAVPGFGTDADLAAGVFAGLFVDIECLTRHVFQYKAAIAEIENNHYKDLMGCNSSYNCGF